jgi:predicted lipoprotein with Yx(FWY)xxD motif
MKRPYALLACLLSTSAVLVALVSPAGAAGTASSSRVVKIQLRHTSLGKILVDSSGFTLYRFTKDSGRTNSCVKTSQCPGTWPAFAPSGTPTAGPGVKASLISSIKLPNGSRQITYAGHPLYHYFSASEQGETAYVGAMEFGGTWLAVNAAGGLIR